MFLGQHCKRNKCNIENIFIFKINFQLIILVILIVFIIKSFNNKNEMIIINDEKSNYLFYYNYDNYLINLTYLKYDFSFKYNIVKVEYNIGFYNENNDLVHPSDLTLYNNLHIICYYFENIKINIYSLPNIYKNKFYKCLEFFNLHEKVIFGINLIKKKDNYSSYSFFFSIIE